jgi:DNA-binding MarR family transcriptional regulator
MATGASAPDLVLAVAYQLLTVGVRLNATLLKAFKSDGAGYTSFFILKALHVSGSGSQKQIAWRLGRKSATLTGPLKQLMISGLVEARTPSHDRRIKYLCITPAGRGYLQHATKEMHGKLDRLFGAISDVELGELDRIVTEVRRAHERAAA